MDIRCSILGHNYQETEVEREREKRGEEEVITLREFRECRRCGNRDLVSENKHVRAVETATQDESEEVRTEDPEPTEATASPPSPPVEQGGAEVLDDERPSGQWPSDDRESPVENEGSTDWPEHADAEDEGYSAETTDGDAPDVEFGGGLAPSSADEIEDENGDIIEAPTDPDDLNRYYDEPESDEPNEDQFELPRGERVSPDVSEYAEIEYVCPNCGFSSAAGGTSLRTGDICPRCKKGYLGEREV